MLFCAYVLIFICLFGTDNRTNLEGIVGCYLARFQINSLNLTRGTVIYMFLE